MKSIGNRSKRTPEIEQFLRDNLGTMPVAEIARKYNVSASTIYMWASDLGVMVRPAKVYHGCDEDCDNCPYDDCYRPINDCHADYKIIAELLRG